MTSATRALLGYDLPELGDSLTIQQASDLIDVPSPTIRSWERRYGLARASRSRGGHRRYSREELQTLWLMRETIARGHRAVDAAAMIQAARDASPASLMSDLLVAVEELRPHRIRSVLDLARRTLGLGTTIDEVLFPGLRQVGRLWASGACDVAQEHLVSETTRTWLSQISADESPTPRHRPILLACGPRDQHTIGLEAMSAMLTWHGWDCRLLGARTPASSLRLGAAMTGAAAVVVTSHLRTGRPAAIEAISGVQAQLPHVFYAGNAFSTEQARRGVPGIYLGTRVAPAADLVTDTVTGLR